MVPVTMSLNTSSVPVSRFFASGANKKHPNSNIWIKKRTENNRTAHRSSVRRRLAVETPCLGESSRPTGNGNMYVGHDLSGSISISQITQNSRSL